MTLISDFIIRAKTTINNEEIRSKVRQVTFFSGGNFLAQIIMMIYAILVARGLGPSQLGIYSGLYAILGVTITFVNFGLDLWMLKEAHSYPSIQVLTGKIIQIKLIFGSLWGFLCFMILPNVRSDIFSQGLVLLAVGDVISDVIFNTNITVWNIQRKVRNINILLLISRFGKLILLIILIYSNHISPITIVSSRFLVSLIVVFVSLVMIKPVIKVKFLKDILNIVRSSAVYGYSEILAMIYANIDVAILSFFSIAETGLYSPASGIIHALFVIPNSLFLFMLPRYSKTISVENSVNRVKPRIFTKKILCLFLLIGLFLGMGLVLSSKFLVISLLDYRYLYTGQLLMVLSPILFFKSITFGFALIIVVEGFQQKRLIPQLVVSVINVIANLILIPILGVMGVALIYVFSEFILFVLYGLIVISLYKNKRSL